MSEPRRAGGRVAQQAETDGQTKPATPADSAMPAKPAERGMPLPSGEADGDWRLLADQIAGHASDFLDALAALGRGEGAEEIIPLLLLEVAQVMLAGAQLGASQDVIPSGNAEPDVGADPDLDALRVGLAGRLAEALWWWQYSYVNQWGTHGGAALRALHAVVAHARLDVADEEIPG